MKSEEKLAKKLLKKEMSKVGMGLVLYEILMFLVFFDYLLIALFFKIIASIKDRNTVDTESFLTSLIKNEEYGIVYIIAIVIGLLFIIAVRKKELFICDLNLTGRKMQGKDFVILLACFMAPQIMFELLGNGLESVLNQIGYSTMGAIDSATAGSTTIPIFVYASFLGPIWEEILFRGVILRKLETYGKVFAILVSAILFGAFHGNLIQGMFATMVGIVLGYVAMEYSIKWSIALHIINNFVFGDMMLYLTRNISEATSEKIFNRITLGFFVIGIVSVTIYRKQILDYLKRNKTEDKRKYAYAFTSVGMIFFMLISLLLGLSGIEKLV